MTERDMLDRLARKYGNVKAGNGPRYVVAEHVKSSAGFDAPRTCDAMVQDLWRSGGHALHGFEVKCSRADWLTELRDPTKAETFRVHVDYWWLVAADKAIVRDDLPPGWGLMVTYGRGLRVVVPAPQNVEAEPLPDGMRAALARSVSRTAERRLARQVLSGDLPSCERFTYGNCATWAATDPVQLHPHTAATARRAPCLPCQLRARLIPDDARSDR